MVALKHRPTSVVPISMTQEVLYLQDKSSNNCHDSDRGNDYENRDSLMTSKGTDT
jgi:hypothetical protein